MMSLCVVYPVDNDFVLAERVGKRQFMYMVWQLVCLKPLIDTVSVFSFLSFTNGLRNAPFTLQSLHFWH